MPDVRRDDHELPGTRPMRVRLYRPRRRAYGTLLLVPGLHFAGPDDPRMDRFAAILANAGLWVWAPFLPDFCDLRLDPQLLPDTERALDGLLALEGRPSGRPAVFSVSFGCLPALRLVAARPDDIASLVVFGGYAQWEQTVHFALHGGHGLPHDPLNRPVVFLNTVQAPQPVRDAWLAFIHETWGREEAKQEVLWRGVADRLAAELSEGHRSLFLQGCGVLPGGPEWIAEALAETGHEWLDPRPWLSGIRCPVTIVHGRDDDVIPFTQAQLLAAEIAHARVLLTGLYGHSGQAGGSLLRELGTMVAILRAVAAGPDQS